MGIERSRIVASGETPWMDLAPGVRMRVLRIDEKRGHFTMMIHASAGSRLPLHRHEAAAEIYILKGSGVHPQTGAFKQGDYVYEAENAVHTPVDFTEEVELFMVNYGPSSFLGPDGSVLHVLDVDALKARGAH